MLTLENVTKRYTVDGREILALADVRLHADKGEFLAVVGRSGSGKSTFLMLLGGLIRPTSGVVRVAGTDVYGLDVRARAAFRAARIGFVFQTFHLVPYLTALQNVLVPTLSRVVDRSLRPRALELLAGFGLEARAAHRPAQLSVGERQRVALARAMLLSPDVILADEPTGNLDPDSARQVMDCLRGFREAGGTVVLVTHDPAMARYASRTVRIEGGRVVP